MKKSSEGVCRFCLQTFSGSTIGRHLSACRTKKERDAEEAGGAKKVERIFRIKVSAYGEFWLHLEMMIPSKIKHFLISELRNVRRDGELHAVRPALPNSSCNARRPLLLSLIPRM
jgi:hypothetical protein